MALTAAHSLRFHSFQPSGPLQIFTGQIRSAHHVAQINTNIVFASISVSIIASQEKAFQKEDRDRAGFDSLAEKERAARAAHSFFGETPR